MSLQQVRSDFFVRFPEAHALDSALRTAYNPTPFFFMSEVKSNLDLAKVEFTLVRLGPEIERRFDINGEVAVFFSPWPDFQRRSFLAISSNLTAISRACQERAFKGELRFSPSRKIIIVVSPDRNLESKVAEWSNDDDLVDQPMVAVLGVESLKTSDVRQIRANLMSEIFQRLGQRNLYRAQKPVAGDDFFGRSKMLRDLAGKILADQNPAIFGLRRSGKTSALRELQRKLLRQNVVVSIVDLQMVDENSISLVPKSIIGELVEDLRFAKKGQPRIYVGSDADRHATEVTVQSLADTVRKIAIRNKDLRIVLAIDEVEHLESLARSNAANVKTLLGALRSSAQLSENVSLLFSGVVNSIFLASSLGPRDKAVDNPMFGQVDATYLKPFTLDETKALLCGIGKPMFVEWTDEAIEQVQSLTGGSPFFVRELAAETWDLYAEKNPSAISGMSQLGINHVAIAAISWRKTAARTWTSIVEALQLHYADAAYLLSSDVTELSLNEWIGGEQQMKEAADCLVELGFFNRKDSKYFFTEALVSLRSLGDISGSGVIWRAPDGDILSVIDAGESQYIEFKGSARIDLAENVRKGYIEDAVVKTVAGFLNSDGGVLLIGVEDGGSLIGISPDLLQFGNSTDRFERWLMGDLLGSRIGHETVQASLKVKFPMVRGVQIVHVEVRPNQEAVFVDDKAIFVRVGNQTRELTGREMVEFVRQRESNG